MTVRSSSARVSVKLQWGKYGKKKGGSKMQQCAEWYGKEVLVQHWCAMVKEKGGSEKCQSSCCGVCSLYYTCLCHHAEISTCCIKKIYRAPKTSSCIVRPSRCRRHRIRSPSPLRVHIRRRIRSYLAHCEYASRSVSRSSNCRTSCSFACCCSVQKGRDSKADATLKLGCTKGCDSDVNVCKKVEVDKT